MHWHSDIGEIRKICERGTLTTLHYRTLYFGQQVKTGYFFAELSPTNIVATTVDFVRFINPFAPAIHVTKPLRSLNIGLTE